MSESPLIEPGISTGADRIAFRKMLENAACVGVAGDFSLTQRTFPLILDAIEPLIRADERRRLSFKPDDSTLEAARWKAETPQGTVKGIAEVDARRFATVTGGRVYRSWVRLSVDGTEVLGPWVEV